MRDSIGMGSFDLWCVNADNLVVAICKYHNVFQ